MKSMKELAKKAFSRLLSPQFTTRIGEPVFSLLGRRGRKPQSHFLQAKRVLVIRVDQIGDVVLMTPFLRELRRNLPQGHITLIVKPAVRNLVELCPYVNEVLTFDWNVKPGRFARFHQRARALRLARRSLWKRRFDLALHPRWDYDEYEATFLAYASGARERIGYSESVTPQKAEGNAGYDRFLTHVLHDTLPMHEVKRNLALLRFLGGAVESDRLEAWAAPKDNDLVEQVFAQHGVRADEKLVALSPTVGGTSLKEWPLARFVALGHYLQDVHMARILLIGAPGEEAVGEQLYHALGTNALMLIGQLSLRQTVALLSRCALLIGADSGSIHLASACGTPTLALFGPSCPHRFGPWSPTGRVLRHELPCDPCMQAVPHQTHQSVCSTCIYDHPICMDMLTVAQVSASATSMLTGQIATVPILSPLA